ncbi:MAG: beta-ketoacyl-ACP synthase 3 [Aerococcaceae bacterium]|nr:beta-ketoacyl-ACP synthase 3 [Aerococcaceae bacterium]
MSRIIATGAFLPEKVMTNDQFVQQFALESTNEWIVQRTGIEQRHMASAEQTVATLAIEATKDLLQHVAPEIVPQIQHIIVATMSAKLATPSIACQVQAAIGAPNAWAFDLNGACSGFVMALDVANHLSKMQPTGYTLVIGAEKMTDILDLTDRSTAVLFGDGAGAVLIEHDGTALPDYQSTLHVSLEHQDAIATRENDAHAIHLHMQGRDVFNFVNRTVIASLEQFIHTHHLEDYEYLICHQANQRLLDLFAKQLNIAPEKVLSNIQKVANTSAASIPILIHQSVQNGTLKLDGTQSVILSGFGGGLAWGHIHAKI